MTRQINEWKRKEKEEKNTHTHTSEEVHVDERLKRGRRSTARPTARINFRG
jgi:hypothetical protein